MQPDNSNFVDIRNTPGHGPVAVLDMENGDGVRKQVGFDMLAINIAIGNVQENLKTAKSQSTKEFNENELSTFEGAREKLRAAKKI